MPTSLAVRIVFINTYILYNRPNLHNVLVFRYVVNYLKLFNNASAAQNKF